MFIRHDFLNSPICLYFTTGTDYANRTTTVHADTIKIDITPPIKTDQPIKTNGRHIVSKTAVEAW